MTPDQVQAILNDFANRATRVGSRLDGAELWRFDVGGKQYELHYWIDDATAIKKYIGGARAGREFAQLQTLQKLTIPATRVIANLKGFRIGDRKGDACIVVFDPTVKPLRELLLSPTLKFRDRLALTAQFIERLESLYRAKLCPTPLTIDRFAIKGDQILLADVAGELGGIVTDERLRELDRSTQFATRATERLRFWKHFREKKPPGASRGDANDLVRDATRGDGVFGKIAVDEWVGYFVRKLPTVVPWLDLGEQMIEPAVWVDALPSLLNDSSATAVKKDHSGSVHYTSITMGERTLDLILKRPAFKSGFRGVVQRFRTSRALRTWRKTWRMLGLGFPCEVPLLVLEKRSGPRVTDQLLVFARVPGETLAKIDLAAMSTDERCALLHSSGRLLRKIEAMRFTHADAKNTNWIAWRDARGILRPILIDLDGIRFYPWRGLGIERFVRAMKTHPQITADDVRAIEHGYRNLVPSPGTPGEG